MILDVRIITDRDGHVRVRLDGRVIPLAMAHAKPSSALRELARIIDGCAWIAGRSEVDVIADSSSRLYEAP